MEERAASRYVISGSTLISIEEGDIGLAFDLRLTSRWI
jgi:hypothetical protein